MNKRLSVLFIASVLLFVWVFQGAFLGGGQFMVQSMLGQVGVSVGVSPNEFNTLAQELQKREQQVAEREQRLLVRDNGGVTVFDSNPSDNTRLEWYVTFMSFILLILVLMNFYLDWRRAERNKQ